MTTETRVQLEQPLNELDWVGLTSQSPTAREQQLQRLYGALAALPESTRLAELRAVVATTYALPDEAFRALPESRLRAWLTLDEETAASVARSYDAVLREVPANAAMRRVAMVQTLMRDFTEDEQRRLRRLNPPERARAFTLLRIDRNDGGAGSAP